MIGYFLETKKALSHATNMFYFIATSSYIDGKINFANNYYIVVEPMFFLELCFVFLSTIHL